jgi:Uma2 family endonuclease
MSSATLMSVQEYLATSYRPDREFLDGALCERNLGEFEHSLLQSAAVAWFWTRQKEWNILPLVAQRVQAAPSRFRVPDVTVLRSDQPRQPIVTTPPLILIEVLSKDDTLRSMRERVDDYLNLGVKHVWILDPASKRAYVCSQTGFQEPEHGTLVVPNTPIRLVLSELFDQIKRP